MTWMASWEERDGSTGGGIAVNRLFLLVAAAAVGGGGGGGDLLAADSKHLTFLRDTEDDGEIFFSRWRGGTTGSLLLSPLPTEVTAPLEEITPGVKTSLKAGPEHSSPKSTRGSYST